MTTTSANAITCELVNGEEHYTLLTGLYGFVALVYTRRTEFVEFHMVNPESGTVTDMRCQWSSEYGRYRQVDG